MRYMILGLIILTVACGSGTEPLLRLSGGPITEDRFRHVTRQALADDLIGAALGCSALRGLTDEEAAGVIVAAQARQRVKAGIPQITSPPEDRARAAHIVREECRRLGLLAD